MGKNEGCDVGEWRIRSVSWVDTQARYKARMNKYIYIGCVQEGIVNFRDVCVNIKTPWETCVEMRSQCKEHVVDYRTMSEACGAVERSF